MDGESRGVYLYLAGVTLLAAASIGLLVLLFVTGFPDFVTALLADPRRAVQNDPTSVVLFVSAIALVVLLFAFVVVVGVKNAPNVDDGSQ